jgi:hypothetical protein
MAVKCRLQKLEPENLGLHCYLDSSDECFFIGEYTSDRNFNFSEVNSLISNIKKKPEIQLNNPKAYQYKIRDLKTIGNCFSEIFPVPFLDNRVTIVPIPPSKTKSHSEYDDRMFQICQKMVANASTPDVRDLIVGVVDKPAMHTSGTPRPPPHEKIRDYALNIPAGYTPRPVILLIDDVLTTGSTYKACKNLLLSKFPDHRIIGIFIARRVKPPDSIEIDFEDLDF